MMRTMKSKAKKQGKLMKYIGAPIRVLAKARDFYVDSMADCAGRVGYDGAVVCPVAQASRLPPKSFNFASSKVRDEEELRQLLRALSKRNYNENKVKLIDTRKQTPLGCNGVAGRTYSVGVGRIGRIDEERPCEFLEEELNARADFFVSKKLQTPCY